MTSNEELLTLALFGLLCACDEDDPEDPEWNEEAVAALALIKMEIVLRRTQKTLDVVSRVYRRAMAHMKRNEAEFFELINELTKRLEEEP